MRLTRLGWVRGWVVPNSPQRVAPLQVPKSRFSFTAPKKNYSKKHKSSMQSGVTINGVVDILYYSIWGWRVMPWRIELEWALDGKLLVSGCALCVKLWEVSWSVPSQALWMKWLSFHRSTFLNSLPNFRLGGQPNIHFFPRHVSRTTSQACFS